MWTDKELNLKLMRKGILTRVYAPSVSSIAFISNVFKGMVFYILLTYAWLLGIVKLLIFFSLQVIIQSLRESGVFSTTIASAMQTSVSKESFLKSVESSNSSRELSSGVISSRKIGNSRETQTNGRKVLEITEFDSHPLAIPPLSPPGLHDFHIDT